MGPTIGREKGGGEALLPPTSDGRTEGSFLLLLLLPPSGQTGRKERKGRERRREGKEGRRPMRKAHTSTILRHTAALYYSPFLFRSFRLQTTAEEEE